MRLRLLAGIAVALAALVPITARADMPWPASSGQPDPYAYQQYLYAGAPGTGTSAVDCNATTTNAPNDLDCNDWHLSGRIDHTVNGGITSSQELGGVMGPTIEKAWDVTTGRPDIHIAVLDSGIEWNSYGDMLDLRNKVALNWAELPPPEDATGTPACAATTLPKRTLKLASPGFPLCYDLNHDGVFNIQDFAADPRVNPPNHTWFCGTTCGGGNAGLLTPEDLIEVFTCWNAATDPDGASLGTLILAADGSTTCSNGTFNVDNDGNGFPHDIAGWNFMEHTNDPFDEPHYGHGTGEAEDSNAEANNGNNIGTCPSCMVLPLKVGDSFIADVNDFAQAVLYATDNQVNIVQEALGTLDNSALNQAAIDYAYNHGVTIISSAADEEASHHNQPASSENHTIVVNSLRLDDLDAQDQKVPSQFQPLLPTTGKTYLSLNGCTNYGGHIDVSVPSASCSSEATGKSAGMAGLIYSIARDLVDSGKMERYSAPSKQFPNGIDISPDEVKQVMTMTADDVDFEDATPAQPRGDSPADSTSACAPVTTDPPGRPDNFAAGNAGSRFSSIGGWDQYYGYGRVNANCMVRAVLLGRIPPEVDITSPRWFANLDPSAGPYDITGRVAATRASSFTYSVQVAYGVQPHENDWTTVYTSPTETAPVTGTLASISGAQLQSIMPAVPGATPPPNCADGHTVDPNGDQADWLKPPYNVGPCQNYWDEYTFTVRVRATDDQGRTGEDRRTLQAQHDAGDPTGNGAPRTGFPQQLADQFGYSTDGASSPLMADLLGDNQNELVFGTSSGLVHALRSDGSELPGFPLRATQLCASQPPDAHTKCLQRSREPAFRDPTIAAVMQHSYAAILGSVAVGDLQRTGKQEIVFADLAGYVYSYEISASYCASLGRTAPCLTPGFPVHNTFAFSRQGAPPLFNRDHDNRVQFGFIAGPTLADLDGKGKLSIIDGGLDRHLYAWHADGDARKGFPVLLQAPEYVSSVDSGTDRVHMNQTVPYGTKIVSSASVADLMGNGQKEIIVGRNEEYTAAQDGGLNASADSYNPTFAELGTSAGLFTSGNGRVYAVYSDGTSHPAQSCNAAGHGVPTQAYVCGWPVKVVKFDEELLPEVASGVDTPPAVMPAANLSCPGDATPGDRVGVFTSDGPPYIFAGDGKSCYGQGPNTSGQMADRVLNTSVTGAGSNTSDTPYLEAVGNAAFGDLTGTGDYVLLAPTAGLVRAADAVLTDHQFNAMDGIGAWSLTGVSPGSEPQPHPGFPSFMDDLQFLTGPAVADLTGTGSQDVIEGSAVSDLRAITPAGTVLPGWAKNTNGWTVSTPAVGTLGTDQHLDVASLTREGTLFVWQSAAGACAGASWPRYKHDNWNSGNYSTDAGTPERITDLQAQQTGSTVTLTFTAPHGDLFCGNAAGYEVRVSATAPITDGNWASAVLAAPKSKGCRYQPAAAAAAGTAETITLTHCPAGPLYLAVQAYNDASRGHGNLGAIAATTTSAGLAQVGAAMLFVPFGAMLGGLAAARRRRAARRVANL